MKAADVQVGMEIPTFVRKTDFDNWNRFAAVNYEFVPIHMADEWGQKAGLPGAIGMGRLQLSYLHNMLGDWLGEDGRIVSVATQFRGQNLRGQTLTAKGKVTAVHREGEETIVELDVSVEADNGTALAPGTAMVAIKG
jgi:acyl dehydratase